MGLWEEMLFFLQRRCGVSDGDTVEDTSQEGKWRGDAWDYLRYYAQHRAQQDHRFRNPVVYKQYLLDKWILLSIKCKNNLDE